MASIVVYNPSDPTVADRVTKYHKKAHTPDFDSEPNKLVNPDLASVSGEPLKYWKVSGGEVVAMSGVEKSNIDALAPKAKAGIHNLLTFTSKVKKNVWTRIESFVYEGATEIGEPYEIDVICYVDSGVTADLRLYDKTNGVVLGTLTFTNTEEDKKAVDIVFDWPSESAIIEVQVKRTAGTKKIYVNGMLIGY